MSAPQRIQRSRAKGWRMPFNAVYVGRPSRWGNPFKVEEFGAAEAVRRFERALLDASPFLGFAPGDVRQLRRRTLCCWCKVGEPCHGDVLLLAASGRLCRAA